MAAYRDTERRRRVPGAGRPQPPAPARPPERAQRPDAARALLRARDGAPVGLEAPRRARGGRPRGHRAPRSREAPLPERGADRRHRRALDRPLRRRAGSMRSASLKRTLEETPVDKPSFVYKTYVRTTPELLWRGAHRARVHPPLLGHRARSRTGSVGSPITWVQRGLTIADPEQVVLEYDPYRRLSYAWHVMTAELAARSVSATRSGSGSRRSPARRSASTSISSARS